MSICDPFGSVVCESLDFFCFRAYQSGTFVTLKALCFVDGWTFLYFERPLNRIWKGFNSSSMPLEFMLLPISKNNNETTQLFLYIETRRSMTMNCNETQLSQALPCLPSLQTALVETSHQSIRDLRWSQGHLPQNYPLPAHAVLFIFQYESYWDIMLAIKQATDPAAIKSAGIQVS